MRKIAPLVLTSLFAFAGAAVAQTTALDSKTGSPTVPANTANPTSQSYSDKSNTSPGTNAIIDEKAKLKAEKKAAKKKGTMADSTLTTPSTTTDTSVSGTTTLAPSSAMPSSPSSSTAPVGNNNAATVNSTTGKSPQ